MNIATISFLFCICGTVLAGFLAMKRGTKTSTDFLLSGRDHGAIVTSLSASATDVSGWVLMGLVGMAFTSGISVIWVLPAGLLGYFLNWGLVARRLRESSKKTGCETFPEFLSSAFEGKWASSIRLLASIIILVFLTLYLSGQFSACAKALRSFFGLSYETGVFAALILCIPYIVFAGMRGTSWSDVVQAILIIIAVLFVPLIALNDIGGISNLLEKLKTADPTLISLTGGKTGANAGIYIIFWLSIGLAYPGQPQILTRFMAAKDDQALTRGRWIAVGWFVLVASMAVLAGLCARAKFSKLPAIAQDAEQIMPALAEHFLPAVLVGVAMAAVTAAIMSSADSMVLVILTTLLADVRNVQGSEAKDFTLIQRGFAGIAVAVVGAVLAFMTDRSVFAVVLDAWAILGSSFAPVVIYRLWISHSTPPATIAGMLSGATSAILLNGDNYQIQIIVSIIVSIFVITITHLITLPKLVTDAAITSKQSNH